MTMRQVRVAMAGVLGIAFGLGGAALRAQAKPQIEDGIVVPDGNTPWAVDVLPGKRELVRVHAADIAVNNHRGANVAGSLAGSVFYKPKMTTELAGAHARTQMHTATPVLYVEPIRDAAALDSGETSDAMPIELVRAQVAKDKRTIQQVQFTAVTGGAHRKEAGALVETEMERLPTGWWKITPKQPLSDGEYALVPITRVANTFSTVVWAFGVDKAAPESADSISLSPQ